MSYKIIYPNEIGIAIVNPTGALSLIDTALKDVPAGVPYLIVEASEIPTDRTFRNAWEADFSNPDGYGLGHEGWVAWKAEQEANNESNS